MATNRSLKQAEMERRIEADQGDLGATVYVRVAEKSRKKSEGFTYHEDRSCQHLDTDMRNAEAIDPNEYSRKGAQLRWKAPCLECILTEYSTRKA